MHKNCLKGKLRFISTCLLSSSGLRTGSRNENENRKRTDFYGILGGTETETKTKWSSTVPEQKRYSEIHKPVNNVFFSFSIFFIQFHKSISYVNAPIGWPSQRGTGDMNDDRSRRRVTETHPHEHTHTYGGRNILFLRIAV